MGTMNCMKYFCLKTSKDKAHGNQYNIETDHKNNVLELRFLFNTENKFPVEDG
jgi:hypothetical protein